MIKRVRHLHISLAAKCQLLFGAAVVLIIAAALFWPWQRMEQLMEKINERSAATVAETALNDHVTKQTAIAEKEDIAIAHTPAPGTQPVTVDGKSWLPPRMVGLVGKGDTLTKFERAAIKQFQEHPEDPFFARYYETKDGTQGYRYALPLKFERASCTKCH